MTLDAVRGHLRAHFPDAEPDAASITFLGTEPIEVLRFRSAESTHSDGLTNFVTLGCSRHPMTDPTDFVTDPLRGPRAEVVLSLRNPGAVSGLARSLAIVAATPAVEGMVLVADALIDLGAPLWAGAPFTAVLLGRSEIEDMPLSPPREPVQFFSASPVTATEAAWVRLKGADAMRQAWVNDGVDVLDPNRRAVQPD